MKYHYVDEQALCRTDYNEMFSALLFVVLTWAMGHLWEGSDYQFLTWGVLARTSPMLSSVTGSTYKYLSCASALQSFTIAHFCILHCAVNSLPCDVFSQPCGVWAFLATHWVECSAGGWFVLWLFSWNPNCSFSAQEPASPKVVQ